MEIVQIVVVGTLQQIKKSNQIYLNKRVIFSYQRKQNESNKKKKKYKKFDLIEKEKSENSIIYLTNVLINNNQNAY